jgi:alpha-glucosidase
VEASCSVWWRSETIYQVYPRSFQDVSGNGVGDLRGIRGRLGYLRGLGVDAVWLSPIFASPMKDMGYDVADYCAIDPLFGTMEDFEALLEEAHDLGLRLLLDFVPNHTSDQHPWFEEARAGRDSPKRDWYIWKDAAEDGGPPNNWLSTFGGSAWEWDETSGQYYYHAYLAAQPDLNWRNPEVRAAMYSVLRFWLDKGVDGFRVDVIWRLIKDEAFRNDPPNPAYEPGQPEHLKHLQRYSADQPGVHEVVAEMRKVIDEYDERLLIGEIYLPLERLMDYYGNEGRPGVHLPFNFQLLNCPWRADAVDQIVNDYERALPNGGWPNWVLGNHDQPRIAARVGEAQAAVAAVLLLTLRGTPTIYYGDEIGLGDIHVPEDRVQDCWARQEPQVSFNRDKARTPMQWANEAHAGFSTARPWLPLSADWTERNVETMESDPTSLHALYRRLLDLRRAEPALQTGDYRRLFVRESVFAYERNDPAVRIGVFLNFAAEPWDVELPQAYAGGEIVLTTNPQRRADRPAGPAGALRLGPDEALLIKAAARA